MKRRIGYLAYQAMLSEAEATPKPGLVDCCNNGAHKDMDIHLFRKSALAIWPYLERLAELGAAEAALPAQTRLAGMRGTGMEAERAMFAATGGVNTHKGAIFTLGLLAYACGRLEARDMALTPGSIGALSGVMCADLVGELLRGGGRTKGERAYLAYGATGIRGEAAAGFPSVLRFGLPALQGPGLSQNDRMCDALMRLVANVTDTNVLTRAGAEGARYANRAAAAFLAQHKPGGAGYHAALSALDADFIKRNLSPGGCADLAAAACFLDSVCRT